MSKTITIDNYLDSHYIHRSNWLRAAVLGANDGIISISSLAIGVAAASSTNGQFSPRDGLPDGRPSSIRQSHCGNRGGIFQAGAHGKSEPCLDAQNREGID